MRWWLPLGAWLVWAAALTVIVLGVVRGPGRLDDPDPAEQRTGVLSNTDGAASVRRLALPGDPVGHRPVVIVFDRAIPALARYAKAISGIPREVAVILVVAGSGGLSKPSRGAVLVDARARVARTVGMHAPRDGGPPVGYAVLDASPRVRYATLDPSYLRDGFELGLIAKAVR